MLTVAPDPVLTAYGVNDLANLANFQGGYINFGYWRNILIAGKKNITLHERIQSSAALYDLIFNFLLIKENENILEVGCGRGLGCASIATRFAPQKIIGIDIVTMQIKRAMKLHRELLSENTNLAFLVCTAESLPFQDNSFEKIFSVEAAQHFSSVKDFALEAKRVLKPDGRLVLTAHFSTSRDSHDAMQREDLFVKEGIDKLTPIQSVLSELNNVGFQQIAYNAIGKDVFAGYERWISQVTCKTPWSHNIYQSYLKGYLEYYVIKAK